MNKILTVALKDLRITMLNPSIWIDLVLLPAVLITAVAFANGAFQSTDAAAPAKVLVDVVNHDDSPLANEYLTTLRSLDALLVLCPADNDAEDICEMGDNPVLDDGRVALRLNNDVTAAYLEIPAGFGESLLSDQPVSVIYRSTEDVNETSSLYETVQVAAQRVSGAIVARRFGEQIAEASFEGDPAFVDRVYAEAAELWAANPASVAFSEAPADAAVVADVRRAPGFRQSVPGMGSMYVMFTVMAGVALLIQERRQWTMQRLITMPVRPGEIVLGQMLARFVLGMIQFAIAFGIGLIFGQILGFNFGDSPLGLVLVASAFCLCICALTFLLATLVQNEDQASSLTTLTTLILAPIGGAWWSLDLEFIPEFMRLLSYISPFRWVMQGFNKVIFDNAGVVDVLPEVAVLLIAAAVLGFFAARRFRYE